MPSYHQHGVAFHYPDGWTVAEERSPEQTSITVQSDATSYWLLTLHYDRPAPEELAETVADAFRSEYEEFDVYPTENPAGNADLNWEMEFVCMELLNSAWLRVYQLPNATVMILAQGTDHELTDAREELDGITRSLRFELFDFVQESELDKDVGFDRDAEFDDFDADE